MKSLGMIETRGLLAAIESADVMLKAAEVTLVNRTLVGGGLVTIIVTGDVGAVKASVEAGISAVERISRESLVSSHVIPRPHGEIKGIFLINQVFSGKPEISEVSGKETAKDAISEPEVTCERPEPIETEKTEAPESTVKDGLIAEESEEQPDVSESIPAENKDTDSGKATGEDISVINYAQQYRDHLDELISRCGVENIMEALGKQTVIRLRSIARDYKSELGMKSREVSDAGRERLLNTFKAYLKQKSEENNQQ